MAYLQMCPPRLNFANSLKADMPYTDVAGNANAELGNANNYTSIGNMRVRLAAANGTYYTSQKLDQMSVNDMVFALRSIDDRTTICDYMPVSTA